jgi:peptidoglycan/LPS O-acetylase OafA/YrhL
MIRWSFFDFFLPDAFGKTWVALFYALLLILTLIAPRAGRVFINPVLIWLGTRAFALYLLHSLMLELTHAAVRHSSATVDTQMGALTTLLALGFTCGLAALSWNLLEAPLTERARRCFIYQRLGP